ncbi:MAG TPA: LysM peptidoglycan-binding domain-containing protein [Solirubrobacterales bacterium]|nr:LysM peptidoglycan-binding domain-containing protein [Solirubrobacterales bacterium]
MAQIIRQLTSIRLRSGSPPGRRVLALMVCMSLVFGSVAPGFAIAGESDSEGEGTTPPIEVPVGPPDFDPGGEETGLDEEGTDSSGEEEGTGVEIEAEAEATVPAEGTGQAPEVSVAPPPPISQPAPELPAATQPEAAPQTADEPTEPVANESISAPPAEPSDNDPEAARAGDSEPSSPAESVVQASSETPAESDASAPASLPVAVPPRDHGPGTGASDTYVVRPGDCLWHIAAALLPAGSDTPSIAAKVEELWMMNQDRIGTDDPNLIYPGTVLRLR